MASLKHFPADAPHADIVGEVERSGGAIVDGFISPAVLDRFNAEINALMAGKKASHGHVNASVEFFHGPQTKHLTGVPGISDTFVEEILLHPLYEAMGEHFLKPWCADFILNLAHVLERGPGAGDQLIHRDQDIWPRTLRNVVGCHQFASLLALGDYTAEMGATRVVPGSHMWEEGREPLVDEIAVAEMEPGSAVLYLGATLHAAGPNTTLTPRRGMHTSFCLGWLRTEENLYLAVPEQRARKMPRRAQELLGFGIHDGITRGEGFLGALDNRNPIDVFAEREAV